MGKTSVCLTCGQVYFTSEGHPACPGPPADTGAQRRDPVPPREKPKKPGS